jgi:heptosyltransferase-2
MKHLNPEKIGKIVVRGTNWVGDAVMGVPALRELRKLFPKAKVTLVVRPWAEGLFQENDFVDDLLIYERHGAGSTLAQIAEWRRRQFDLAILFQNAFEAALISFLARIPNRIGYATDGRRLLLTHALPVPDWRDSRHEVFYYLNIISEIARLAEIPVDFGKNEPNATIEISDSRRVQARQDLKNVLPRGGLLVALCPGSINSRAKRWPAERYAELGDRLVKEYGANVVIIGSKEECEVSAEVMRQMKNDAIDLTGKTSLDRAVGILSLVDLLVTNDTGSAHIASALGRPTLVIFGPTNPLTTRPYAKTAEILRHPPDCAPCMLRDCPIDHRCMTAISVEEVFERAKVMLSKHNVEMAI